MPARRLDTDLRQFSESVFSKAARILEACKSSRANKLLRGAYSVRNNALLGFWIGWDDCLKNFYQNLCSISYKIRAKLDQLIYALVCIRACNFNIAMHGLCGD